MGFDPDSYLAARTDPLASAFAPAPKPLYSESLYNGTGQLSPEQLARMSASPPPINQSESSGDFDPDAYLGLSGKESPGYLESFGRGALQGLTLGFSDELTGLVESAFTDKSYARARDESRAANKRARDEGDVFNKILYGAGEVGGGIASGVVTGGSGIAARAGLTGVKAAVALGAAEGALSGAGTSEGGVDETIKDALIGGATGGALAGAAGKIFGKYAANAERKAVRDVTKELTEGALPTQSRRFADIGELGFDILEPDKAFMKVAKSRPERAAEIASDRLRDLGPRTKPIYQHLDREVGKVPLSHWENHFNERINAIRRDHGLSDNVADALEEARDGFVAKMKAKYGSSVTESSTINQSPGALKRRAAKEAAGPDDIMTSHQDVRDFVTNLYKHKFRKLGTINETENAELAAEAFAEANSFLKGRLDMYRVAKPNLSPKLDELTDLNRQIKAWAAAESLMDHKTTREFWKRGGLEALASGKMGQLGAVAGVGAAVATGNPLAAGVGLVPKAVSGAASAFKAADRKITSALASLSKAARAGDLTKAQYLEALKSGVPSTTAMWVINAMKNRPKWADEDDGSGE